MAAQTRRLRYPGTGVSLKMKKTFTLSRTVPLALEDTYRLAADMEQYPEFIPSVKSARKVSGNDKTQIVEIVFDHSLLSIKHVGRATFRKNQQIEIRQIEGLGKNLSLVWRFEADGHNTHVSLVLVFESESRLFGSMAAYAIERISREILHSFIEKANDFSKQQ